MLGLIADAAIVAAVIIGAVEIGRSVLHTALHLFKRH
jgi:hypothetical protein